MKEYLVKTNFGYTYKITAKQVADDYAEAAYQFQDEDNIPESDWKSEEQLADEIMKNEKHLDDWYVDQISGDIRYISRVGEVVSVDEDQKEWFWNLSVDNFGHEVFE